MQQIKVASYLWVLTAVYWILPSAGSPMGPPDQPGDDSGAEEWLWHSSEEAAEPREGIPAPMSDEGTEDMVVNNDAKIAESRSILTTLLSPFVGNRPRPGHHRGPYKSREQVVISRRPPQNRYVLPVTARFRPKGIRGHVQNPTQQPHVFQPILASPVSINFPALQGSGTVQTAGAINSLTPINNNKENLKPDNGDTRHTTFVNNNNPINTASFRHEEQSHFSVIPDKPFTFSPSTATVSSPNHLNSPPHHSSHIAPKPFQNTRGSLSFKPSTQRPFLPSQTPNIRISSDAHNPSGFQRVEPYVNTGNSLISNEQPRVETYLNTGNSLGSNKPSREEPYINTGNSLISNEPVKDTSVSGFVPPNSISNFKSNIDINDQFLKPFTSNSHNSFGFNNNDFFITGNVSDINQNNRNNGLKTGSPNFTSFPLTTRDPFAFQPHQQSLNTQRITNTPAPISFHTNSNHVQEPNSVSTTSSPHIFVTEPPLKSSSHFFVTEQPLKSTTHFFVTEQPLKSSTHFNVEHVSPLPAEKRTTSPPQYNSQTTRKLQHHSQPHHSQTTPKSQFHSQITPKPKFHSQVTPKPQFHSQVTPNPQYQRQTTTSIHQSHITHTPQSHSQRTQAPVRRTPTPRPSHQRQTKPSTHHQPRTTPKTQYNPQTTPSSHQYQQATTLLPNYRPPTTLTNQHYFQGQPDRQQQPLSTTAPQYRSQPPKLTSKAQPGHHLQQQRHQSPQSVREVKSGSENYQNGIDPFNGFLQGESQSDNSDGFIPFSDSNDFFNHIFGEENPFGEKLSTQAPTDEISAPARKYTSDINPPSSNDHQQSLIHSISQVTSPSQGGVNVLDTASSITSHQTHKILAPVSDSNTGHNVSHLKNSPLSSTLSNHSTPSTTYFATTEWTLSPFRSSPSVSTSSQQISSQSVNVLPKETTKDSTTEGWSRVQQREPEPELQTQDYDQEFGFNTDTPLRIAEPFTTSEGGENPYTTSDPSEIFHIPVSGREASKLAHGPDDKKGQLSTISGSTIIDDKEFEVLVLPYEDQERGEKDLSPLKPIPAVPERFSSGLTGVGGDFLGHSGGSFRTDSSISLDTPPVPSERPFQAGLPLQPAEEEVSVYLVRHLRPSTPEGEGGSPTPPTTQLVSSVPNDKQNPNAEQGRDQQTEPAANNIFEDIGQDALEFRGFPIPVDLPQQGKGGSGSGSGSTTTQSSSTTKLETTVVTPSGRLLTFEEDELHNSFLDSFDPEGFDPSRDFEGEGSLHVPIEVTEDEQDVTAFREPDEYVQVLGLLAPPPGVICNHGICAEKDAFEDK